MKYPKIYLTLDSCFAIKHWTTPDEILDLTKEIGFTSVEASFDNEMDMLYNPEWYMTRWFDQLDKAEKRTGVHVDTFCTGYQSYRTAGFGHADDQMADYLTSEWMIKAAKLLGKRGIHIGFSFAALRDEMLQDPAKYEMEYKKIVERLARVGKVAAKEGIYYCTEAMYAPHQPSWTIEGTKKLLADIYEYGYPVYSLVDVGHMVGQRYFAKPTKQELVDSIACSMVGSDCPKIWLGARHTLDIWKEALSHKAEADVYADRILADMENYPYMFSTNRDDDDPYKWLEQLACYAPIIHMQQTNGVKSGHFAFDKENNKDGIVCPIKVLEAIKKAYDQPVDPKMPPRAEKIFLAFEIFASNTEYYYKTISKLKDTAKYFKQYIPEDGIAVDELLRRLGK